MTSELGEGIPLQQQEQAVDPEVLVYPTVLRGIAHDIYSLYARDVEGSDYYLTTPVEQQLALNPGETNTVVIGCKKEDVMRNAAVYILNTETQTLHPYITFDRGEEEVLEGEGTEITEPHQRQAIRDMLLTIKARLNEAVRATAEEFNPHVLMEQSVDAEIGQLEEHLATLQALKQELASGEPNIGIKVVIVSGWAPEGESPLEVEYSQTEVSSLAEAIERAVEAFKQLNGRSDVQARSSEFSVSIGGQSYAIPREVWSPYYSAIGQYQIGERWAISYREDDLEKSQS